MRLRLLIAAIALWQFPLPVLAHHFRYTADLTGPAESPPNNSTAIGPAVITASGGTISDALNVLFFALEDGKAYFNIQTTAYTDGEIRGFLSRVPGDYNDNGVVAAADYVLWRKTEGTTGEGLKADSDN